MTELSTVTDKEVALYRVKNLSTGTRMIQTSNGKHAAIPAKEVRELKLTALVARNHAQFAANNPGKYMDIYPVSAEARGLLSGAVSADPSPVVADTSNEDARKELLERADTMDINELRSEARLLLKDRWPRNGGNYTRERVKDLLSTIVE